MRKHDVLVLNKNFEPLNVISWQTAMNKLVQDDVRALDKGDDYVTYTFEDWLIFSQMIESKDYAFIYTAHRRIALPEVVVQQKYERMTHRFVKYNKKRVFQRDRYICAYCGTKLRKEQLTQEHVIPQQHGGPTTWTNIVTACKKCNNHKANRTPEQAGMPLLYKPYRPTWVELIISMGESNPCKTWHKFTKR